MTFRGSWWEYMGQIEVQQSVRKVSQLWSQVHVDSERKNTVYSSVLTICYESGFSFYFY